MHFLRYLFLLLLLLASSVCPKNSTASLSKTHKKVYSYITTRYLFRPGLHEKIQRRRIRNKVKQLCTNRVQWRRHHLFRCVIHSNIWCEICSYVSKCVFCCNILLQKTKLNFPTKKSCNFTFITNFTFSIENNGENE